VNRPRVLAVLALVAAFAGAGLTAVWLSVGDSAPHQMTTTVTIRDPLAEALRQIPRSAPLVAVVDTDAGAGPLRQALDLLQRVPGADAITGQLDDAVAGLTGLSLTGELASLSGEPLVIAKNGTSAAAPIIASWVVPDAVTLEGIIGAHVSDGTLVDAGAYRGASLYTRATGSGGGAFAQRDRLLVFASDLPALKAALKRGERRAGGGPSGMTRGSFTSRSTSGVNPARALVRVAVTGPALIRLLTAQVPKIDELPWVAAVQGAGIGVTAQEDGLRVQARLRTDETTITETDLPIARGRKAPTPVGEGDLRVSVRNLAQPVSFLMSALRLAAPNRLKSYDQLRDLVAKVAQVDVEDDIIGTLTGPATVTADATGTVTLRALSANADQVRTALGRLRRIGQLAGIANGLAGGLGFGAVDTGGFTVDQPSTDTYTISKDGNPVAVVGVRDDVVVLSTDPLADVDSIAGALDDGEPPPDLGAFRATLTPAVLGDALVNRLGLPDGVRVAANALGDAAVTAHAELGSFTVRLDVPVTG
jgi:hypothetical protein